MTVLFSDDFEARAHLSSISAFDPYGGTAFIVLDQGSFNPPFAPQGAKSWVAADVGDKNKLSSMSAVDVQGIRSSSYLRTGHCIGHFLRQASSDQGYVVFYEHDGSALRVTIHVRDNGLASSSSSGYTVAAAAGDTVWMESICNGTSVEVRLWNASGSRPSSATHSATLTLFSTGVAGFRKLGASGTYANVDQVLIADSVSDFLPAAPILSSPTAVATGPTQATVGVTTDTAPATTAISYLLLPAADAQPTAATIVSTATGTITTGAINTALTVNLTGLTTGVPLKAHFAQGATSNVRSTASFTPADTTNPVMTGNITAASITTSGFVLTLPSASDNVAVAKRQYRLNGGTWTDTDSAGTSATATVTGLSASTPYTPEGRALDVAGNASTPPVVVAGAGTVTTLTPTGASVTVRLYTDALQTVPAANLTGMKVAVWQFASVDLITAPPFVRFAAAATNVSGDMTLDLNGTSLNVGQLCVVGVQDAIGNRFFLGSVPVA